MSRLLGFIIIATVLDSLASLVGIFTLSHKERFLRFILMDLVAMAAGSLLAGAFLHLLPESIMLLGPVVPLQLTLFSFIGFFLFEKILRWHHCHDPAHESLHVVGYMNLGGDMIHNFIDGMVIAGAFVTSFPLGFATTIAIIFHEIPQEFGDFAILVHSGFTVRRALLFNVLVGATAILGGIAGYFATVAVSGLAPYLLPIAAGGFIYISASDLIPEIHKENSSKKTVTLIATFLFGVAIMFLLHD
jgi:zinc and cadmium transporter